MATWLIHFERWDGFFFRYLENVTKCNAHPYGELEWAYIKQSITVFSHLTWRTKGFKIWDTKQTVKKFSLSKKKNPHTAWPMLLHSQDAPSPIPWQPNNTQKRRNTCTNPEQESAFTRKSHYVQTALRAPHRGWQTGCQVAAGTTTMALIVKGSRWASIRQKRDKRLVEK